MKPTRIILPAATGIFGLLLGLALAPAIRKPDQNISATTAAGLPKSSKPTDQAPQDPETNLRTRARERVEDKKPREPRVSIPLKTMVQGLTENAFKYSSDFRVLESSMGKASLLIGATNGEQEELKALVRKSKADILAAEKTHIRLGEVTANKIQMDMSAMRGPAQEIAAQTKEGIQAALPPDLAEALISAITWNSFYPLDERWFTYLEITRRPSGKLTAWEKQGPGGTGHQISEEFKDDGTPLPAERIFLDRWKPFLKGVTILPKDEEE